MYYVLIQDGDETTFQAFETEDEARAAYREVMTWGAYGYVTLIRGEVMESTMLG